MIPIKRNNIDKIATAYYKKVSDLKFRDRKYSNVFSDNINELVLCKPEDFKLLITKYAPLVQPYDSFKKYMIGQYERVFYDEQVGSWLAGELNINVCPYCNRQYTFTIRNDKGQSFKPQFDHFYSKADYPYLALSFYNLIPSCPECNRIKSNEQLKLNPYLKGFEGCKFEVSNIEKTLLEAGDNSGWSVGFANNTADHNVHIEKLALDKLYDGHKDYISEIIFKAKSYPKEYVDELRRITDSNGTPLTESQIMRLIYGNYTDSHDFEKRPLSKLTADILEQLEVDL